MCYSIINYILTPSVGSSLDPVVDHTDGMLIEAVQRRLNQLSAEK